MINREKKPAVEARNEAYHKRLGEGVSPFFTAVSPETRLEL